MTFVRMREAVDVDYFPNIKPYLTPPYVLGEPEIVWRELHPATGEQLKFIILATDGCKFPLCKVSTAFDLYAVRSVGSTFI